MWKDLFDKGYFVDNANADDWTDASDKVARGEAGDDADGHLDHRLLERQRAGAGRRTMTSSNSPTITDGVPNAAVGPVDGLVIAANAANAEGAEKLLSFMVSDAEVQADWANAQGALSANVKVDPAIYNAGDAEGRRDRGRGRGLCLQLRPRHAAAGGRSGPVDVHPVHGRPVAGRGHSGETQTAAADAFKK